MDDLSKCFFFPVTTIKITMDRAIALEKLFFLQFPKFDLLMLISSVTKTFCLKIVKLGGLCFWIFAIQLYDHIYSYAHEFNFTKTSVYIKSFVEEEISIKSCRPSWDFSGYYKKGGRSFYCNFSSREIHVQSYE